MPSSVRSTVSTEPAPLLLGSSLAADVSLFIVADPGIMRNAKVPTNALIAAFRAKTVNPRSGQGSEPLSPTEDG